MHTGLTPEDARALWFTEDGHWNQRGSDRFASVMAEEIARWWDQP